ncbi:MAG: TRAP transporter small permease subunit [Emergencia sp.]|nr:TRAP transporter small permease subunit [Emergencia sp.]
MTKSLKRIYERPEKIMQLFAWLSAAIVLFNFVLLCANVFMRYAFHSPIKGTTEIVAMMMAWVAYMGMPYTYWENVAFVGKTLGGWHTWVCLIPC